MEKIKKSLVFIKFFFCKVVKVSIEGYVGFNKFLFYRVYFLMCLFWKFGKCCLFEMEIFEMVF